MGASSSDRRCWKTRGNGTRLHFYPESDQPRGNKYTILSKLVKKMSKLIDVSEPIKKIWVYKHPLSEWQLAQGIFNHQFVVFETRERWWSIEKNQQGIFLQRSICLEYVKDHLLRKTRNKSIEVMSTDKGKKCVNDLLKFLEQKELYKTYDVFQENCQHFAERIFDEFAANKYHNKIKGAY